MQNEELISKRVAIETAAFYMNRNDPIPLVIDSLKELQPVQSGWIPVSERLPEERGYYLTTTKNGEVYCDYWDEDNFNRTELVIAWMSLPEPYKGGKYQ